ncbi:hypothetical protein SUDANB19_05519 [Streptomyces sp. enrichment culture]
MHGTGPPVPGVRRIVFAPFAHPLRRPARAGGAVSVRR